MPTKPVENPDRRRYRLNITVQMPEPVWDVNAYIRKNLALGLNLRAVAR
jgi:predicted amidohydrolase